MNCSKVLPFTNIKIRRKWLFSSRRGWEGERDRRTAKAAVVRKRQRDWGREQKEGGPGDTAGSQADMKSLDFLIFQHTCCNFHCCFLRTAMNFHRLRVRLTSNETCRPRPRLPALFLSCWTAAKAQGIRCWRQKMRHGFLNFDGWEMSCPITSLFGETRLRVNLIYMSLMCPDSARMADEAGMVLLSWCWDCDNWCR